MTRMIYILTHLGSMSIPTQILQLQIGFTLSALLLPAPSPPPRMRLPHPTRPHHHLRIQVNPRTQIRGLSRPVGYNNMNRGEFHLLSYPCPILSVHDSHKAFFYVNTAAPNPAPTWEHPLGPAPASPWPHTGSATSPSPAKIASPPPTQPTAPGDPENPDKRPLPTGWIQQYEPTYAVSSFNISLING